MKLPTPHLEKLQATLANDKLPPEDKPVIEEAMRRYSKWVKKLQDVKGRDVEDDCHENGRFAERLQALPRR